MQRHGTLKILGVFVEVLALARAAISTWLVVEYVTQNLLYTAFTVGVVEGVLLLSLILMSEDVTAPIAAFLAIAFSAVMQYMELRVLRGTLTANETEMLGYVIAFAPIVLLALVYVRRLFAERGEAMAEGLRGLLPKSRGLPPQLAVREEVALEVAQSVGNGATANGANAHPSKPVRK